MEEIKGHPHLNPKVKLKKDITRNFIMNTFLIGKKSINKNKSKGFTLIELLVVIAIIGLLSSIVLVSLNSVRAKARDARRKSDLRQISLALELYYDANSHYPVGSGSGDGVPGNEWRTFIQGGCNNSVFNALTSSGFMPTVPEDPSAPTYRYFYEADGDQGYWLGSHLENTSDPNYTTFNFTGCTPFTAHYVIER